MKITFSNLPTADYAFDPANEQGLCLEYNQLYNSDAVTATLPPDIDRTKLKFITTNQTEISFDETGTGKAVELTLPADDAGKQYSLHAVYQTDNGINWTLSVDNEFNNSKAEEIKAIIPDYQLTTKDEFFSEYSQQQNDLNSLYKNYASPIGATKKRPFTCSCSLSLTLPTEPTKLPETCQ